MNKFVCILFLFCFLSTVAFSQSISTIKKEKEKSEKEIAYLNKLLSETKNDKTVSIGKLNILQHKIVQSKKLLNSLSQEMGHLEQLISANEIRMNELQTNRASMLDLYGKLVYGTWKKKNKSDKLMFIFSSSDFNQAYNRFKYFQQIQEYSNRQLKLIAQVNDSIELKNSELKALVQQKNILSADINAKNKNLEQEQKNENVLVSELQKKEKEFLRKIQNEVKKQQRLEQEITKLIAEQNKKRTKNSSSAYKLTPELKLISDDFVKNKGKLPWPVAEGFISEQFGSHVHPLHKLTRVTNSGINITTSKNADVRCVFKGVVSLAKKLDNFDFWYVIIDHGVYMTVYSNLMTVNVKAGQKVDVKDVIGKVAFDSEKGNVLQFCICNDSGFLNPESWLAK